MERIVKRQIRKKPSVKRHLKMIRNDTSPVKLACLWRKPIAFEVSTFISSLPPLVGADSADIESSYTFCVKNFNKKIGLGLASSV